jgi:hypothetical protein
VSLREASLRWYRRRQTSRDALESPILCSQTILSLADGADGELSATGRQSSALYAEGIAMQALTAEFSIIRSASLDPHGSKLIEQSPESAAPSTPSPLMRSKLNAHGPKPTGLRMGPTAPRATWSSSELPTPPAPTLMDPEGSACLDRQNPPQIAPLTDNFPTREAGIQVDISSEPALTAA